MTVLAGRKIPWNSLGAAIAVSALVVGLWETVVEPDLFSYLALGRWIFHNEALPHGNPFTYAATPRPWVNHTWPINLLAYLVHRSFGFGGLAVYRWALGLFTAAILYIAARRRGASHLAALSGLALSALFFAPAFPLFLARNFEYCFFAANLLLLEETRTERKRTALVLLPLLYLLWANCHMSVPAGFIVMGLYAACGLFSRPRPHGLLAAGALCFAATFVTPFGFKLWENFFVSLFSNPQDYGGEWLPINRAIEIGFDTDYIYPFLALLPLAALLFIFYRRDITARAVLAVTAILAFSYARQVLLFVFAFAVYAPKALDEFGAAFARRPAGRRGRLVRAATTLALLLAAAVSGGELARKAATLPEAGQPFAHIVPARPVPGSTCHMAYPIGAVSRMKALGISGDVLTYSLWGGYVSWEMYPRVKSAVDGRIFEEETRDVFDDYVRFYYGLRGWRRFLERFPPDYILVHAGSLADLNVAGLRSWREIYRDELSALYEKKNG